MAVIIDIATRAEIATDDTTPPRNESVAEVLEELRKLNEEGRIVALVATFVDQDLSPSYTMAYPLDMPPNLYLGALEMTKLSIMGDVVAIPRPPKGDE